MSDYCLNVELEHNAAVKSRLPSIIRTVYHVLSTCLYWAVLTYGLYICTMINDEELKEIPVQNLKWFMPLFATNWNYAFQTIFLTISLVYDVMEWRHKQDTKFGKKLKYCRDVLFSGLVLPITLFISCMFWTIYNIDRELVFPVVYDKVVPWWFNHCVHTNITIVLLIETILQPRRHPADHKIELVLNTTVNLAYAIVYYSIFFFSHRWLYAVFGIMTWWQVCLYQLLIWASTYIFYYLQFPINRLFHKEIKTENKNGVGEVKNGEVKTERESPEKNGSDLKFRSNRNPVENSSL